LVCDTVEEKETERERERGEVATIVVCLAARAARGRRRGRRKRGSACGAADSRASGSSVAPTRSRVWPEVSHVLTVPMREAMKRGGPTRRGRWSE
jgi:hypothetical protein